MKIKRTTSNKNSWYAEEYDENLFGGKIPDGVVIPEGIEVDPRMLSESALQSKNSINESRMDLQAAGNKVINVNRLLSAVSDLDTSVVEERDEAR